MRQSVGQQLAGIAFPTRPSGDQIAQRAYEIYERDGRPFGKDREHWHRAEMELLAEFQTRRQVESEAGLVSQASQGTSNAARPRRRSTAESSSQVLASVAKPVAAQARCTSTGDARRRRSSKTD